MELESKEPPIIPFLRNNNNKYNYNNNKYNNIFLNIFNIY